MNEENNLDDSLDGLIIDIGAFIELSFQEDETALRDWIKKTYNNLGVKCWELKQCDEDNCPAYKNECGRCWLIAGTMCGGMPQGKFVEKYSFCSECEVYQNATTGNRVSRLRELTITLIHGLRQKQLKLQEALEEIKSLRGIIPICSYCHQIRDDGGGWNKLEAYLLEHSHDDAEFSHGICPDCAKEHYPEFVDEDGKLISVNER